MRCLVARWLEMVDVHMLCFHIRSQFLKLKGEREQSSGEQAAQVQVPAPPLTAEEITGKFSKPF